MKCNHDIEYSFFTFRPHLRAKKVYMLKSWTYLFINEHKLENVIDKIGKYRPVVVWVFISSYDFFFSSMKI